MNLILLSMQQNRVALAASIIHRVVVRLEYGRGVQNKARCRRVNYSQADFSDCHIEYFLLLSVREFGPPQYLELGPGYRLAWNLDAAPFMDDPVPLSHDPNKAAAPAAGVISQRKKSPILRRVMVTSAIWKAM
jgi:hypothetical protein